MNKYLHTVASVGFLFTSYTVYLVMSDWQGLMNWKDLTGSGRVVIKVRFIRMISVPAQNRKGHTPNTSQLLYHLISL